MLDPDDTERDPMPVFVIKGKDALGPITILHYMRECQGYPSLQEQATQVQLAYEEMAAWQRRNPDRVKLPDHPHVPVAN